MELSRHSTVSPSFPTTLVAIGLNLSDRLQSLRFGLGRLRLILEDIQSSSVYESEPVGITAQPPFLNACCVGVTQLAPRQLLSQLQDAERAAGRRPSGSRFGPRELDLDVLLWGTDTIRLPGLEVPHPRIRERAFVLVPLAEIAPHWIVLDPSGAGEAQTVAELEARADTSGLRLTEHVLR